MTSPRKSRSTLRRVERAAMRWYEIREENKFGKPFWSVLRSLYNACAAHAAAKAKRGKG